MSRVKAIFTDDWPYILEVYRQFLSHPGAEAMNEIVLLIMLEISVGFGDRVSEYRKTGLVEIGCGLAIPSLTLAESGCPDILAIDIDLRGAPTGLGLAASGGARAHSVKDCGGDWEDFNE